MGKKSKGGQQKGSQGPKVKPVNVFKAKFNAKAKDRKTHSKAVKTNLKKISMDNAKKIDLLNADHNKVVMTPTVKAKQTAASSSPLVKKKPVKDEDMPNVGEVADILENL